MVSKEIIVEFQDIDPSGASVGNFENKKVLAFGVLPQEKVKVRIIKKKRNFLKGEVVEVINKSPHRVLEKENHYLSCSPWQIFEYKFQIELKKNILDNLFQSFLKSKIPLEEFFISPKIFEYRTKIEFSFLEESNQYWLSFYKRENHREKIKLIEGCLLIDKKVNSLAQEILNFINKSKITEPKALIARKSIKTEDTHFSLLTKKEQEVSFQDLNSVDNFVFAYSNPLSGASNFDKILFSKGKEFIREEILGQEFQYHYSSFFQNNIELFEKALEKMKENAHISNKIVDLYCGVGVIGISLKDFAKEIVGIDINSLSIDYAKINSFNNKVDNFKAFCLKSEKIETDFLKETDILVLDPPRSGISKKLIKIILKEKPKKIFYLSCNPLTQIQDLAQLQENYFIKNFYAFDFYPNTPHFETLAILEIKKEKK
ncbi:MAG: 23S rRNA (uracil-5-)-methyltransferase RumA [Candidatus Parcubacteria bacterium]|nr:MAG: 23S rRNA (uracil-5-)-methyltransferase RumA [Candidatus Parcubacteria bacterium]